MNYLISLIEKQQRKHHYNHGINIKQKIKQAKQSRKICKINLQVAFEKNETGKFYWKHINS